MTKVYTVGSLYGLSGCPDDTEAVKIDGEIKWPGLGQYNLSKVVYFRSEAEAEAVKVRLGSRRSGDLLTVMPHDAEADYVSWGILQ